MVSKDCIKAMAKLEPYVDMLKGLGFVVEEFTADENTYTKTESIRLKASRSEWSDVEEEGTEVQDVSEGTVGDEEDNVGSDVGGEFSPSGSSEVSEDETN